MGLYVTWTDAGSGLIHVAPCVVCVMGQPLLVLLAETSRPPGPTQFSDFPRRGALDAGLPPHAPKNAHPGNRSHDLAVVRPKLSLVTGHTGPATRLKSLDLSPQLGEDLSWWKVMWHPCP